MKERSSHVLEQQRCEIIAEVKRRTGTPKWWCKVHHAPAWGKDGARLDKCAKADVAPLAPENVLYLDPGAYGGVALWGALPAVYDTTNYPVEHGVHVHARLVPGSPKMLDDTFAKVFIKNPLLLGDDYIEISEEAACAYVSSVIFGKRIKHIHCSHCGHGHLDADWFAVNEHKKHLCNACGRHFFDSEAGIHNPLILVKEIYGDTQTSREVIAVDRPLVIIQRDFPGGIQIWASNPAIIWTSPVKEEQGLHIHCYTAAGRRVVDDTYGHVQVNGKVLDHEMVRYYMAQKALPHLQKHLVSLRCPHCGEFHFDKGEDAIHPHKLHICDHCSCVFDSPSKRKLTISNPIISVLRELYEARQ